MNEWMNVSGYGKMNGWKYKGKSETWIKKWKENVQVYEEFNLQITAWTSSMNMAWVNVWMHN